MFVTANLPIVSQPATQVLEPAPAGSPEVVNVAPAPTFPTETFAPWQNLTPQVPADVFPTISLATDSFPQFVYHDYWGF
jgi:hypothetical protein